MRNLTQSTYRRITYRLRDASDRFPRYITIQDIEDLLEAYESAVRLLDLVINSNHSPNVGQDVRDAEEFLYTEAGEPRVKLDE